MRLFFHNSCMIKSKYLLLPNNSIFFCMKKALFIGHSYHLKTKSSIFLLEILQRDYDITEAYIDPMFPISYEKLKVDRGCHFDLLVIWQVMPHIEELQKLITWDFSVFFPMYDHYKGMNGFYDEVWKGYTNFTIICFSKALYKDAIRAGFDAKYIQYYPKPRPFSQWGDEKGIFFWQRISSLNIGTLVKAVQNLQINHLHFHKAIDPGHKILPITAYGKEVQTFMQNIQTSDSVWFKDKSRLIDEICKYSLYMAPRYYEGIGMSFLDAMALGRCVIAPDTPTMNEYITNGVNGLLFPWDEFLGIPEAITSTQLPIRELQANAIRSIQDGYTQWEERKYDILRWCKQKAQPNIEQLKLSAIYYGWEDWPLETQPWPDANKLEDLVICKHATKKAKSETIVSVITVTYNLIENHRKETFLQCLDSVQAQEGIALEHVIVDGGSSDGTIDIINHYDNNNYPIRYISLKDNGIYDAMNRGLVLGKGEYVIFLNSDDYYHYPEGIKKCVETLKKTLCDFTFSPIIALNATPPLSPHITPANFLDDIFVRAVFSHQTVLVKRDLMIHMHGFDQSYRIAADYDFILRLLLTGHKGCYVEPSFVSYRMTGLSSVNQMPSMQETGFILRRLFHIYFNETLTHKEAYQIPLSGCLPKNRPILKHHLSKIIEKSFVGIPKTNSYLYKFHVPELIHFGKSFIRGRFKHLFYFLLISFNSRFNRTWYLHQNRDVFLAGIAPAAHYLDVGWREGRDPSLRFSTNSYLQKNPDVAEMDICPLIHWKLKGKHEHRSM